MTPPIPSLAPAGARTGRIPVRRPAGVHPSLVDIMCCLVILFLLTSLLAATTSQEARERTLPPVQLAGLDPTGAAVSGNPKPLVITAAPGPRFFLAETPVPLADLPRALAERSPGEVEVRGDESLPYGTILGVMRACERAGISRVALAYQPIAEPPHREPLNR